MRALARSFSLVVAVAGTAASAPAAPARAQDCGGAERWAEACAERENLSVEVLFCPPGGVVLEATVEGGPDVRVELTRGRPGAFRTVRGVGVSPVGDYPDWDAAPEGVRAGFERVLSCVRRDADLELPAGELVPTGADGQRVRHPDVPIPWLLLVGAGLAIAALVPWRRPSARERWTAGLLGALGVATFVLRERLWPHAFAHQNGQGPFWVESALCGGTSYGPGYHEVMGLPATLSGAPEAAVFTMQALLAALGPICAFGIARAAGARGFVSAAIAVGIAMDPGLARLAGSESYFATQGTLLLAAGAVLAISARRGRVRDKRFVLGALAAGVLVAQAARIHPGCWVAAALLPLVVAVGVGPLRARLRATAAATAIVGAVTALGLVDVAPNVLGGELGQGWLPRLLEMGESERQYAAVVLAVLVVPIAALLSRKHLRGLLRGTALALTVWLAARFYALGPVPAFIRLGYDGLYAAPAVAALAACLAGIARNRLHSRLLGGAILAVATAVSIVRAPEMARMPTDALEQRLLLEWRRAVPDGSSFAYVGAAGRRRLFVPIYATCRGRTLVRSLATEERIPSLAPHDDRPTFYYRSSLCSSEEARPLCERIERAYVLDRLEGARLPARSSMAGLDYDRPRVDVALFRVRGRREP